MPENVNFTAEEMGMLLGLKDHKVCSAVASLDAIHNSTMELVKFFGEKRTELTDRLAAEQVHGDHFSGVFTATEKLRLEPHIFEVNQLVQELRARLKKDYNASGEALDALHELFRTKWALPID